MSFQTRGFKPPLPVRRRRRSSILRVKAEYLVQLQKDENSNSILGWVVNENGDFQKRKQRTYEQHQNRRRNKTRTRKNRKRAGKQYQKRKKNRDFLQQQITPTIDKQQNKEIIRNKNEDQNNAHKENTIIDNTDIIAQNKKRKKNQSYRQRKKTWKKYKNQSKKKMKQKKRVWVKKTNSRQKNIKNWQRNENKKKNQNNRRFKKNTAIKTTAITSVAKSLATDERVSRMEDLIANTTEDEDSDVSEMSDDGNQNTLPPITRVVNSDISSYIPIKSVDEQLQEIHLHPIVEKPVPSSDVNHYQVEQQSQMNDEYVVLESTDVLENSKVLENICEKSVVDEKIGDVVIVEREEDIKEIEDDDRLPVTILSGFLGSGKTTLLQYILENKAHGMKIAVIVNDMAELNVDARLIRDDRQHMETMIEMENGCICCTLREDLLLEIKKLALMKKFDYLIIEATGISEPLKIAETFTYGIKIEDLELKNNKTDVKCESFKVLMDIARLDTLVTIVDAKNFQNTASSVEPVPMPSEKSHRNVAHLLMGQIEFANVVLINKCDLIDTKFDFDNDCFDINEYEPNKELTIIKDLCSKLNPFANIFLTAFCELELHNILCTEKFSFSQASSNAEWLNASAVQGSCETKKFGIESYVYRSRKPFHPMRIHLYMAAKMMKGVFRAKGYFWIATKHDICFNWNQAGEMIDFEHGGTWFATIPEKQWQFSVEVAKKIKDDFCGRYGDRRQEIVFIGQEMDVDVLKTQLDFCLLTKSEMRMGPVQWKNVFQDPFMMSEDESSEFEDSESYTASDGSYED